MPAFRGARDAVKLAIVGGGSTYTPELFEGLIANASALDLSEVVFEDIDEERLDVVLGFCRRMAAHARASFETRGTTNLADAVAGASFVVIQVRVGGQRARHRDESIPLRHGLIGQETTGAGGFAKALRTIPVVLGIAATVREHAPDAWVVNFTNPSGIVTEALVNRGGVRAVGLCNIPITMRMEAARALGVDPDTVDLDYAGLNHLGFVRGIRIAGHDVTPAILDALASGGGPRNVPEVDFGPDLFAAIGAVPSPYLRYYYATEEVLAELRSRPTTRAQDVMAIEERLLAYYRDPSTHEKPALLAERGGTWYSRVAIEVILGLMSDEPRVEVVNTTNRGAISGIPDDAVVEVPARVSRAGVYPLPVGPLPEEVFGLVRQVKSYERLTIEAAVGRSHAKALAALLANPLVRTLAAARAVLADLKESGDFDPA